MDAGTAGFRWRFGPCVLDESTLELHRDGQVADIERKPLEVLRYLLRHAGEVVTKDELQAAVWPGRVLSESVLTKALSRLREVIGDVEQSVIKTVHGYGYRFIAEVQVEAAGSRAEPVLGLKVGDAPPGRPQWQLAEHLRSGGHGEVWRVVHGKTGDTRVLKFALNADSLNGLKREITLFRLLRLQLGDAAPIAQLLDWNLEELPYFLELTHYPAGNLADWATAQGGLEALPLVTRLALCAQIAEALAQTHAVGVLHKDLKPSNVLVDQSGRETPLLRLADFGSGAVLETSQLDALGITRLGLTQAAGDSGASATPLYAAPELLAQQPPTVKSDLYALGVMLYQFVVADFRRPLSAGWERNVDDPLLREDIALAADGNPQHRLGDASQLAQRLRTLESRRAAVAEARQQAEAQQAALAAVEAQARKIEQLHARRTGLLVALAVAVVGIGISLWLYRQAVAARQRAEAATATAEAVSGFLNYDVLAATEQEGRDTRSITVKQLLDEAAAKVDERFAALPDAAAEVHSALSSSYMQIGDTGSAITERCRSWDRIKDLARSNPQASLKLAAELVPIDFIRTEDQDYWQAMAQLAEQQWGPKHPDTLSLRNAVALGLSQRRQSAAAVTQIQAVIRDATGLKDYSADALATHWEDLGLELANLARYTEAEQAYRTALQMYEKAFGARSFAAATAEIRYARLLTLLGRYPEADALLAAALEAGTAQRNNENALVVAARRWLVMLRLEQHRLEDAEALVGEVRRAELKARGAASQQAVFALYQLGLVREAQGRPAEAAALAQQALEAQTTVPVVRLYGPHKQEAERYTYTLLRMRTLAAAGDAAAAQRIAATLTPELLQRCWLSEVDQIDYWRSLAVVHEAAGEVSAARGALDHALAISQRWLGPENPSSVALQRRRSALASTRPT